MNFPCPVQLQQHFWSNYVSSCHIVQSYNSRRVGQLVGLHPRTQLEISYQSPTVSLILNLSIFFICLFLSCLNFRYGYDDPYYATLKRDPIVAAAYGAALRRGLATVTVEDGDTAGRLRRICEPTTQAASGLSLVKRRPLRKRVVSANTKLLYEERARCYHLLSPEERRRRGIDIGRACRDDYRRYIDDQVGDIERANRVGNVREVARLTKVLTGSGKHRGNIMPTKAADGKPLTESKQLLDAWQEFLGRIFTCADIPSAAYAPVTADDDNDGEVTDEELESCLRVRGVSWLARRKARALRYRAPDVTN